MDLPIQALQLGAIGIGGIILFYTARLLATELARNTIRPAARTMIFAYMGFSLLAFGGAGGLEWLKGQRDAGGATQMSEIKTQVFKIDTALDLKIKNEISQIGDAQRRDLLLNTTDNICQAVSELGKIIGLSVHNCVRPRS